MAVNGPKRSKQRAGVPENREDYVLWDDEVRGLGRRVRPTRETWLYQARVDGKTKRKTSGDCRFVSLEEARTLAEAYASDLAGPKPDVLAGATLAEFAPRYLAECAGRCKPKTLIAQRYGLEKFIEALGGRELAGITRDDVLEAMAGCTGAPATVSRAVAALSDLMRHAELVGLRQEGSNPCQGLRRHKSAFEATYLTEDQYRELGAALGEFETDHPVAVACLRFLALTGCRRGEALALEWGWIDGPRAALPDAKAGPRSIWLGSPARKLLRRIPRHGLLVFTSPDGQSLRLAELTEVWRSVREQIGLPGLRIHDLRHSMASTAIGVGHSLDVVGGLLGHLDRGSTAGYAHLNTGPVVAASARVGQHLERLLTPARSEGDTLLEAYLNSKDRLQPWCEARGLDPEAFFAQLKAYRKRQLSRRAGL